MHTRTIKLTNGSLTVTGDFNLFMLTSEERFAVRSITEDLDNLEEKGRKAIKAQAPPEAAIPYQAIPYPPEFLPAESLESIEDEEIKRLAEDDQLF